MRIDYSINPCSKKYLLIDVPFRQGMNHLGLAMAGDNYGLALDERVKHLALGILKLIPVIGHGIALIDTLCQRESITHLKLRSIDPFERGKEHGQLLKKRIKEVYDPILAMKRNDSVVQERMRQFEQQIPDSLKKEMRGLAEGSGYSYDDVVLIHSFLDAQPGLFGCTSMAVKIDKKCQRIAAANHSLGSWNAESESRRKAFLAQPIPKNGSTETVLQAAGKDVTIQAMVFDLAKGEIKLAAEGTHAANKNFKIFGPDSLFKSHNFTRLEPKMGTVQLFRNLDWPWYFLGQETVVLTRPHANGNSTVSVSWPGYIGTLSGMNSNGLALAENQCGDEINLKGIPNPLLFTNILDTCMNVHDASVVLEKKQHGSSMNLVIADRISAKSYELEGDGNLKCVGKIN